MRGKHYRMTLLVALGVSPGIALAAPGLQNMADSLDELMKFLPMVMAPMFLLAAIVYIFQETLGKLWREKRALKQRLHRYRPQ